MIDWATGASLTLDRAFHWRFATIYTLNHA